MIHAQEKNWSLEIVSEATQVLDGLDKDFKSLY